MSHTAISTHHTSRLLYILISQAYAFFRPDGHHHSLHSRDTQHLDRHDPKFIAFACLIPVLVLLSGVFAGLTLGYMSLDETQLNVLSISGSAQQRLYANKIMPIRKNGHLLLVTLLLANMIVNESLPVISDPVLGGGVQSVVVSTVLIVIFAEIIPQSVFTRHGLYLGAKMAGPTKGLICILGIISWPVAKLLEVVLGPHHGIIYRRSELKELIAMHSHGALHGGDLKNDTVTIIGATLDLQEKVVKQAMTPIENVFMLSIDSQLDYDLLKKICQTGHSRVPVYEEVEVPVEMQSVTGSLETQGRALAKDRTIKVKKIVGILLVKQCVLLDPNDAMPLRKIPLNKVIFVPNNEPLLGILDKFQEGRSHMAIVSRFSVEKAASVKQAVKRGLTRRLMERVGMGDSSDEEEEDKKRKREKVKGKVTERGGGDGEGGSTIAGGVLENGSASDGTRNGHAVKDVESVSRKHRRRGVPTAVTGDLEMGIMEETKGGTGGGKEAEKDVKTRKTNFQLSVPNLHIGMTGLEQSMPADAVLAKEGAKEFLQTFDPAVMPLGIITLEDVLEELIGEEIYDEFDRQGANATMPPYVPLQPPSPPVTWRNDASQAVVSALAPSHHVAAALHRSPGPPKSKDNELHSKSESEDGAARQRQLSAGEAVGSSKSGTSSPTSKMKGLGFLRSRSAPPTPRMPTKSTTEIHDGTSVEVASHSTDSVAAAAVKLSIFSKDNAKTDVRTVPESPSPGDSVVSAPLITKPAAKTVSRSVSPATLEAILLDRKRRLNASATIGGSSAGSTNENLAEPRPRVAGPSVKGMMFKSSPLGGGEETEKEKEQA